MGGNVARGLCAAALGMALAASALAASGAAEGAAGRPVPAGGARLWLARHRNGTATALAVGPGGLRVYVTGSSQATPTGYATVAYSAATGARLWTARYRDGTAAALAVSPDGATVYVTGSRQGPASADFATVAYNAATGARLWVARYNGPANGNDYASAVAVSPGGNRVYVTGSSDGSTSTDYATVAYRAATGARLWAARYNGAGKYGYDSPNAIAVSRGGTRVFVTGRSQAAKSSDYATVAYSAATGARLWAARYQGPGNSHDFAYTVAVSPAGTRVYVTGSSYGAKSSDYVTVAYRG